MIPAELLPVGRGHDQGHHRLADDARRGNRARVGALAQGLRRLLGGQVDAAQRLGQSRQWLHRGTYHERIAGGHAPLETARAVGLAKEATLLGEEDLVVGL